MAATRTIEAVELDTSTDLWCDTCHTFAVVAVRCAIVDADTLEVLRHAAGSLCLGCGAED